MVKEVDRINRVVTDLINFARPMALNPEHVNLAELMQHTVKLVRGDADSKNNLIKFNSEDRPHSVFIDPQLITQVVLNLILNALQSENPGHVINVGISMDADLSNVSFWVEDDGPGIDKNHLDNIFDPFFTTRDKGTGLGLAIVKKIIESHRGKIYVISPLPGKENGCRFFVSIPIDLEGKL
jgi:two-component system sensor histidine kinase HydH